MLIFVAFFWKMRLGTPLCAVWLYGFTHASIRSPSRPLSLVNQATSRLPLHWLSKWNIILARYGEVELAAWLTTNDMPGHSRYMRTWQRFFPRVGDSAGWTAVLLQYIKHTAMEKGAFDGNATSLVWLVFPITNVAAFEQGRGQHYCSIEFPNC